MRPANLKTKIFLDGGDPNETKEIVKMLGFLDGQTTNPTLIAKNPEAAARLQKGDKFSEKEILEFYKKVAEEISGLIPGGSVSIEVPADKNTPAPEMLKVAKEMFTWISNAHIKLPITKAGLEAAEGAVKEEVRVNMTLCFSQEQAAAVYAATEGGDAFVSPFVGRLDDKGENGMDLVTNIIRMYKDSDQHVEILAASIRNLDHLLATIALGADILTAPFKVLKAWVEGGMQIPDKNFIYSQNDLTPITYQDLSLNQNWRSFNISHDLTEAGLEKFAGDWNSLSR